MMKNWKTMLELVQFVHSLDPLDRMSDLLQHADDESHLLLRGACCCCCAFDHDRLCQCLLRGGGGIDALRRTNLKQILWLWLAVVVVLRDLQALIPQRCSLLEKLFDPFDSIQRCKQWSNVAPMSQWRAYPSIMATSSAPSPSGVSVLLN